MCRDGWMFYCPVIPFWHQARVNNNEIFLRGFALKSPFNWKAKLLAALDKELIQFCFHFETRQPCNPPGLLPVLARLSNIPYATKGFAA